MRLKLPVFRIGDYRKKFSMTPEGELSAWTHLFKDLCKLGWKNCILETTGLNKRERFLSDNLFGRLVTIKLSATKKTLYKRVDMKPPNERGGKWVYGETYSHKKKFIDLLFKEFKHIFGHINIVTDKLSKKEVYNEVIARLNVELIYWAGI